MTSPYDQWSDRITIKSETSSREYTVAKRVAGKDAGTWGCTCPDFKSHRHLDAQGRVTCKHLRSMGFAGEPVRNGNVAAKLPASPKKIAATRRSFSDEAYTHYDTSQGFGSAEEWFRRAEEAARGRGSYRPQAPRWHTRQSDMDLLELTDMPADVSGLKAAMRRMALKLHPDITHGSGEPFIAMFAAYERLLRAY